MKHVLERLGILGLGASCMGNLFRVVEDQECDAVFDEMWAGGVRYFDTAPHYGLGLSERRLGRCLSRVPREQYVLSSKVGRLLVPSPDCAGTMDDEGFVVPATFRREWDFSARGVRTSIEQSLERLGNDRLDIVYLHDPEDHLDQAVEEAMPTLVSLREEGSIGAIGIGSKDAATITRLIDTGDIDVAMVAGRYTLLDQSAADEVLPAAEDHDVALVAVGVYNSGILAQARPDAGSSYEYAPAPTHVVARAQAIAAVCERFAIELPHAALHFPLRSPRVKNVTVGIGNPRHVASTLRWIHEPVPPALWETLANEGLIPEQAS